MTRSVLIVDDELPARAGVRELLAEHPGWQVCGECRDGAEAIDAIATLAPDLVLLDIQMPELDGFDVIDCVGAAAMPAVLFLTAHDEHALRAFEVHAVDYLLKPCSRPRFAEALRRVELRIGAPDRPQAAALHAMTAARPGHRDRLLVRRGSRIAVVAIDDVDWIEADDYCCTLHVGDQAHVMRESLRSLEARLDPARFVRIHRAAIVQLDRVSELRLRAGELIVVVAGRELPVSRRRRRDIEHRLGRPR